MATIREINVLCDSEECASIFEEGHHTPSEARRAAAKEGWKYDRESDRDSCPTCVAAAWAAKNPGKPADPAAVTPAEVKS